MQDDVDGGRECILKALCVYLNEDPKCLLRAFVVSTSSVLCMSQGDDVLCAPSPSQSFSPFSVFLSSLSLFHSLSPLSHFTISVSLLPHCLSLCPLSL